MPCEVTNRYDDEQKHERQSFKFLCLFFHLDLGLSLCCLSKGCIFPNEAPFCLVCLH